MCKFSQGSFNLNQKLSWHLYAYHARRLYACTQIAPAITGRIASPGTVLQQRLLLARCSDCR